MLWIVESLNQLSSIAIVLSQKLFYLVYSPGFWDVAVMDEEAVTDSFAALLAYRAFDPTGCVAREFSFEDCVPEPR